MYEIKLDDKWVDVPEWARWVAQDRSGDWFFFKRKPEMLTYIWFSWGDFGGAAIGKRRKNWKEQIYRIVRK